MTRKAFAATSSSFALAAAAAPGDSGLLAAALKFADVDCSEDYNRWLCKKELVPAPDPAMKLYGVQGLGEGHPAAGVPARGTWTFGSYHVPVCVNIAAGVWRHGSARVHRPAPAVFAPS